MLTELYTLICQRLQEAGFAAWAADCVPDWSGFPFVTFSIEPAAAYGGTGALQVTLWQRDDAPHADRLAAEEKLMGFIPAPGLLLPLTGGAALVTRSAAHSLTRQRKSGAVASTLRCTLTTFPERSDPDA